MNITLNTTMKVRRARYTPYLKSRHGKDDISAAPLFSPEHYYQRRTSANIPFTHVYLFHC